MRERNAFASARNNGQIVEALELRVINVMRNLLLSDKAEQVLRIKACSSILEVPP